MLSDSRFWIPAISLAVLAICAVIWSPRRDRLWWKLAVGIIAPFAVVSLVYSARTLLSRILPPRVEPGSGAAGGDASTALALFSIVATLCTGYAFVVVGRFERQRKLLDERIGQAENSATIVVETSNGLQKSLGTAESLLHLSNMRLRAFFQIHRTIGAVDPDESADAFKLYLDLRLLESLICRTDWNLFRFDMEELLVVASVDHLRLAKICHGPVMEFVEAIPSRAIAMFPEIEEGAAIEVNDLVDQFLARVRL